MLKKLLVFLLCAICSVSLAQEITTSPYSFFGVGATNFRGTIENRSMGGISMFSDSIHLNLQNPSGIAHLKLVNFSVAGTHNYVNQKSADQEGVASSTSINYIGLGFPISRKLGFGFGVLPLTSVGYTLENLSEDAIIQNTGEGGMNKVYFNLGYNINKNFTIGIDANYNFGNIENNTLLFNENVQLATLETNQSNLSGFSFKLGATYQAKLNNNLQLFSSLIYTPETQLESENLRQIASVIVANGFVQATNDVRDIDVANTELTLPSEITFGFGLGQARKWFVGAEYSYQQTENFSNRSFTLDNVSFSNASRYKLGGFYIPRYSSLSNYFEKVTYRAGIRYEETGLIINNTQVNEFGISFGVGLPVGQLFSNFNLGFEVGKRGVTKNGLVQENFFNTTLSLSLNDKWFIKTLYD